MNETKERNYKVSKSARAGTVFSMSFEKAVGDRIVKESIKSQVPMSRIVNNILKDYYKF